MADEQRLFELRNTTRLGQKRQLRERIAQLQRGSRRDHCPASSKIAGTRLGQYELEGVRQLWSKHLIQMNRLPRSSAKRRGLMASGAV